MDPLTIGIIVIVIALILMGWAIGHFGTSRRRRTVSGVNTAQSTATPVTGSTETNN